jgi:diguanylate cyclase (GGDEF)-like protein
MRGNARVLVVGPDTLARAVTHALPGCRSVYADGFLKGLWTAGQAEFEGVVLALDAQRKAARLIRALRQVRPQTRIVVTCLAAQEPEARDALAAGADDYVLEPLMPGDLRAALGVVASPRVVSQNDDPLPPVRELVHLGDVLKNLSAGLDATLHRLAVMLKEAFESTATVIQVNDLTAAAGEEAPAVLREPLRHQDDEIGFVTVGRRLHGSYSTADAARLADYAHLIETMVAQARERAVWQDLAWRDDLSGLRNRRYFERTLDEILGRAVQQRARATVLLFDIDNFKAYNDAYGHDTGDGLLREVGALLTRCSREHDVVARYGGDEFVVILSDDEPARVPGSQHPTDPTVLAERFRAVISGHAFQCLGPGAPGPVTLSGGLACFPWDGQTRAELMRAADAALLTAKRNGKNRILLAEQATPAAPDGPARSHDGE